MPTQIIQSENGPPDHTILRVEGEMLLEDALLLEKIALEIRADSGKEVTLDLADLDFLDSESAAVLRRIQSEHGINIEGMEIFLQSAIDSAERLG
jgi:anti-anti-sigma regulatory factor